MSSTSLRHEGTGLTPTARLCGRSAALSRRLWREYLRNHHRKLVLAIGGMIVIAMLSSAQTYLMGPLIDRVFLARDVGLLGGIATALLLIFGLRSAARYFQEIWLVELGQDIVATIQKQMAVSMLNRDPQFEEQTGRLSAAFIYDANMVRLAVCDVFLTGGKDALTVLTMIGLMFFTDWRLALVCLVLPLLSIAPMTLLGRTVRVLSARTQTEVGRLTATVTRALDHAHTIKAFGLESRERRLAADQVQALSRLVVRGVWAAGAILPIVDGLGGVAVAIVIIVGGHQVIAGTMTVGKLVVFVGAIVGAYAPIPSLSKVNAILQAGLAAADRVFGLIDGGGQKAQEAGGEAVPSVSGAIRFEDVRLDHMGQEAPVLDGLSFEAPAGKVTALVGPTGAGKSSVFGLILGFHRAQRGRIWVNGVAIERACLRSLRASIALVGQDATLFDDSIADNIRYGRCDADDAAVTTAARAAGVEDFASQLADGLATRVSENGVQLSGGQRQRVAIARALLRDAPIVLLDEATSAQDPASARKIDTTLATLTRGRTVVVIAHRLSSVKNADCIHVLDEGRIVESGTHDELVARRGRYATLLAAERPHRDPTKADEGTGLA